MQGRAHLPLPIRTPLRKARERGPMQGRDAALPSPPPRKARERE